MLTYTRVHSLNVRAPDTRKLRPTATYCTLHSLLSNFLLIYISRENYEAGYARLLMGLCPLVGWIKIQSY